jgi:hypothetical protein
MADVFIESGTDKGEFHVLAVFNSVKMLPKSIG